MSCPICVRRIVTKKAQVETSAMLEMICGAEVPVSAQRRRAVEDRLALRAVRTPPL